MTATIAERLSALEKSNAAYDVLLQTLERSDTQTAHALTALTDTIKDPEKGIIVQMRELRAEIKLSNRRVVLVLGGLITIANLVAPYLPDLIRLVLGLPKP